MIIFLSATSLALVINAAIAWFAYKALSNMTTRVSESTNSLRRSGFTREWIRTLESASIRAAEVSTEARAEIVNFEPTLIQAEQKLAYSLAKIDKSCERVCGVATTVMNQAGKVASTGYWILDRLFSGARAASAFVRAARAR
jgi:hypothetical protein